MMYEAVRGALAANDALKEQGEGAKFRVSKTSEWKVRAAELEGEIAQKGLRFSRSSTGPMIRRNCHWRDWPAQHLDGGASRGMLRE